MQAGSSKPEDGAAGSAAPRAALAALGPLDTERPRSRRHGWLVAVLMVAGATVALLGQWWTNAVDYPFLISGKPLFSLPANIPVTFEVIILAAGQGTRMKSKLPKVLHPVAGRPLRT